MDSTGHRPASLVRAHALAPGAPARAIGARELTGSYDSRSHDARDHEERPHVRAPRP